MTRLRTEIIKADPDLQKIHNQIISTANWRCG